jgi:O-antigen/teichoic acid export membrane protein
MPTRADDPAPPPEPAPAEDILDTSQAGRAVIRGGVLRVTGYLGGMALSVVSAALLLRYLGARDFGRYSIGLGLITIVTGLSEAGTINIGIREFSVLTPGPRERMLANLLGIRVALTVAGVTVALIFALAAGYDRDVVLGALLAGVGLVVAVVQGTLNVPLQSALRLGIVSGLDLLRQAATVALLVGLVLVGASIAPLLGVTIPAGIVVLAVTLRFVPLERLRPALDAAEWRRIAAVTLPYAAATAIGVVYAYLITILMSLVTTDTEVGIFSAAFRVFVVLAGVPGLLVASAFPVLARAARDDRERLSYAVRRLLDTSVILGTGMALITVVAAPTIIDVLAGSEYEDAVAVLRLQGAALFATFFVATGAFTLLSLHRNRAIVAANAVAIAVAATLVLTLAADHGALGAGIATLGGEVTLGLGYALVLLRSREVNVAAEGRIVIRVAVAAAAAYAAFALCGLPNAAASALAGVVYLVLLLALRALPVEVFEALRGRGSASGG